MVLLLTVYWKADLALFLRPDLEKEKNEEQIWPGAVRPKITILRAVIQSWNFADFDLFSFRKTTDSHFANDRFSFRKLQIFISFRSISFRFILFRSISFRKLQ